jgi:hypothetical protein
MRRLMIGLVLASALTGCGASRVKVEPVTVQPIHVTVDVNVRDLPAPSAPAPAPPPPSKP